MGLEETTNSEGLVVSDRLRDCSAFIANSPDVNVLRTAYPGHLVRCLLYGN
jgi:hypothetical protein